MNQHITHKIWIHALVFFTCFLISQSSVQAKATFTIINLDDPGEGLNDPTPAEPIGGNEGLTLGEQRMNVIRKALDIWGAVLDSNVEILVEADFDPTLTCTGALTTLSTGGVTSLSANFPNAPLPDTWYPQPLANALAGSDQDIALSDIAISFNSNLDNGCGNQTGWYYGLNGILEQEAQDGRPAFLPAVLHRMGHGLGFENFTDLNTGEFLQGTPGIWSHFLFDLAAGSNWRNMTDDSARMTSATSGSNLVWNGPNVTAQIPNVLPFPNALSITNPANIMGFYEAERALYGPPVPNEGIEGQLRLVVDGTLPDENDGCEPPLNDLTGYIALINRGLCSFSVKTRLAQDAGAIGVVIINNVDGLIILGGFDPMVTIPSIHISQDHGGMITAPLALNEPVDVELTYNQNLPRVGTNQGFVSMYAPDDISGSSVNHWNDVIGRRQLMSRPINVKAEPGLSLELLKDIGWSTQPFIFKNGFEN